MNGQYDGEAFSIQSMSVKLQLLGVLRSRCSAFTTVHTVGLFKTDSSIFVLLLYQRTVHKRGEGNAVGVEWVGTSARVISDSKSERKVYEMVVRPTMMHGLETVALTKRQEAEPEVAELKIL